MDLLQHRSPSRNLAHQKSALIAHAFGRDMLKGGGVLCHSVNVHTRLVGKGRAAYVWHTLIEGLVGNLRNPAGSSRKAFQILPGNAGIVHFNLQVGNNG